MLGRTLRRRLARHELMVVDLPEVDILDIDGLTTVFRTFSPDAVVHCAAMTKVDDCETNSEFAFRLNGTGSANVAHACRECGARLVAMSTDYVFSGDLEPGREWRETDAPAPKTVYGASKLAGERMVREILPSAAVMRIAWLYGAGGPSFVHTMAKLGAEREGAPLKVVSDQRGNPTSAEAVAGAVEFLLGCPEVGGIVHATCEGVCSWYGFAKEIFRLLGLKRGIMPCTTTEFPRPAPRPANSALANMVLEDLGFSMPRWEDALVDFARHEFRIEF